MNLNSNFLETVPLQENITELKQWLSNKIVGQEHLIERLLIAVLADGHLLVEGAPGLAKTKAIKTLSYGICLLYTSPSPRDTRSSRMPSSA